MSLLTHKAFSITSLTRGLNENVPQILSNGKDISRSYKKIILLTLEIKYQEWKNTTFSALEKYLIITKKFNSYLNVLYFEVENNDVQK